MKELSDHTDIIITKAHKRGAVVIMDAKHYINEAHRQLNRTAMKELSDHTNIIITKAHKRGAVVIMDVKHYINEAHRQLNRSKYCIKTLQQLMRNR